MSYKHLDYFVLSQCLREHVEYAKTFSYELLFEELQISSKIDIQPKLEELEHLYIFITYVCDQMKVLPEDFWQFYESKKAGIDSQLKIGDYLGNTN